jgi:hypothetical protein
LDGFQRVFRGADAASFAKNVADRVANLRLRAWWLHASSDGAARLALRDSGWSAPDAALLLSDAANHDGVETRAGVLGARRWRPKNALFFPPTLAASASASGVPRALLLGDGGAGGERAWRLSATCAGLDLAAPIGARRAPPRAVRHGATRLRGAQLAGLAAPPPPPPPAPRVANLGAGAAQTAYAFIPTPQIFPRDDVRAAGRGALGVTPLITWGELLATPTLLPSARGGGGDDWGNAAAAAADDGAFRVRAQPARDALRDALVARAAGAADARAAAAHWDRGARVTSATLGPAVARARAGVCGSARATPAFAAAATPSALCLDGGGGAAGGGATARSVVSAATSARAGGSVMGGRRATSAAGAAAALAALPPAARGIARAAAAAGAAARGAAAGDLAGCFSGKRRR